MGWGGNAAGGNGEICNKETSWKRLHDSPPPRRRQLPCFYIRGGGDDDGGG